MTDIPMHPEAPRRQHLWFRVFTIILISASVFATSWFIGSHAQNGSFAWWPYPAFTLMVAAIFAIEGRFSRASDQ